MEKLEKVACAIAMNFYGGYPADRAAREKWPQWKRCMDTARDVIVALGEQPDKHASDPIGSLNYKLFDESLDAGTNDMSHGDGTYTPTETDEIESA